MKTELPWVDQEVVADMAVQRLGPEKSKLASTFLRTYRALEKKLKKKKGRILSESDFDKLLSTAKKVVPGGYQAILEEENFENIINYQLS